MLRDSTRNSMLRLQIYGSMYMRGLQPAEMEGILSNLSQSSTIRAIDGVSGSGADKIAADSQITSAVTQGIASAASVIPVVGSIISLATTIVGTAASASMAAEADNMCDDNSCWYTPWGSDNLDDTRKLMVGHTVPARFREYQGSKFPAADLQYYYANGSCFYGINDKKHCYSRHGAIFGYTHDGSWFYRIPEGAVIGVIGRAKDGSLLRYCHDAYRGRPYTPRTNGPLDQAYVAAQTSYSPEHKTLPWAIISRSDRVKRYPWAYTREYMLREKAVTLYLDWLVKGLPISLLSCMERIIVNTVDKTPVYINAGTPTHPEYRILDQIAGRKYESNNDVTPHRRLLASRYYASVMSMFDVIQKTARSIGAGRVAAIIRSYKDRPGVKLSAAALVNVENAAKAVEGKTKNGATAEEIEAWPAWPIAKVMPWDHLVYMMQKLSQELTLLETAIRTGERLTVTIGNKNMLLSLQNLRPNPMERITWVSSGWGPSAPVIVIGVVAAGAAAYLIWKAFQDD